MNRVSKLLASLSLPEKNKKQEWIFQSLRVNVSLQDSNIVLCAETNLSRKFEEDHSPRVSQRTTRTPTSRFKPELTRFEKPTWTPSKRWVGTFVEDATKKTQTLDNWGRRDEVFHCQSAFTLRVSNSVLYYEINKNGTKFTCDGMRNTIATRKLQKNKPPNTQRVWQTLLLKDYKKIRFIPRSYPSSFFPEGLAFFMRKSSFDFFFFGWYM